MSYDSLLLIKRKWMKNIVFLKSTHPSFSPIKEDSTSPPIFLLTWWEYNRPPELRTAKF